jgi:hypothetical protein
MAGIDLNFNYGLERVTVQTRPVQAELPDSLSQLSPAEAPLSNQLAALFERRSWSNQCLHLLKPILLQRGVLSPAAYHLHLRSALQSLQQMQGKATDPAQREKLTAAGQLLEGELENRALLDMYRSALLRG